MVKLLYFGSPQTKYAVGIAISEGFSEVERSNDRLMELTIISADGTIHFFTAYLPKTGRPDAEKTVYAILEATNSGQETINQDI